ncbi:MAG TPA: hypothetical protein DCW90_00915 [Lachnospiraceae bacterium]|nr:hypothetical protein [Lachnospiraceae bacterium]
MDALISFLLLLIAIIVIVNLVISANEHKDDFSASKMNKVAEDYSEEIDRIKDKIKRAACNHEYEITVNYPSAIVCDYFINKKFAVTKDIEKKTVTISWEDVHEHSFKFFT